MQATTNNEFIVYSRRKKKTHEDVEQGTHPEPVIEFEPNPDSKEINSGNNEPISSELDDLDLPIVKRKGVRSCTNHPIYNYISYKNLSPGYQTFISSLSDIKVPNTIQEALKITKWKVGEKNC